MMTTSSTMTTEWLELTTGKQFSRLLYTNPVCFLSTYVNNHDASMNEAREQLSESASTTVSSSVDTDTAIRSPAVRNVMILSWLTATNNEGQFCASLHKHRHTRCLLESSRQFCLSIPTKEMESLVLQVGSVSGKWGSKFPHDYKAGTDTTCDPAQKRSKKPKYPQGIPGLETVGIGTCSEPTDTNGLFAIKGTIAHLECHITQLLDSGVVDEHHVLVIAQVTRAFVDRRYWDSSKNLFRPLANVSPYLTFFGSQTFGYVVSHVEQEHEEGALGER